MVNHSYWVRLDNDLQGLYFADSRAEIADNVPKRLQIAVQLQLRLFNLLTALLLPFLLNLLQSLHNSLHFRPPRLQPFFAFLLNLSKLEFLHL